MKTVRFFLAKYTFAAHKILPVIHERRPGETKQKNAANQQKWLAAVLSGVPGQIRTADLSLTRRTLYPADLQRRISNLFNFPAQKDSNELALRRRTPYPPQLQRRISNLCNFPAQKDSNDLPLRRRSLYPAELRKRIFMFDLRSQKGQQIKTIFYSNRSYGKNQAKISQFPASRSGP